MFEGNTGWVIDFDMKINKWEIKHKEFPDMKVTLKDLSRRPFGRQTWEVESYTCNYGNTQNMRLQLSACYENQFTCADGTCIPHEYRCDNKQDCKDVSDEKQCKIISYLHYHEMRSRTCYTCAFILCYLIPLLEMRSASSLVLPESKPKMS